MMVSKAVLALVATYSLASSTTAYTLTDNMAPNNFFPFFDFFTDKDPTNGYVKFQSGEAAATSKLAMMATSSNSTSVFLGVDQTNIINDAESGRPALRLQSKKSWNKGLFIADIAHMPGGVCGVWPALWLVGPDWPNQGEVDIIEGVNDQNNNSMTLHTSAGCSIQSTGFKGKLATSNCDVNDPNQDKNAGCGIHSDDTASFGKGFNAAGGGVYATEITDADVKIWFFPRSRIPADITATQPDPTKWGTPSAAFKGECSIPDRLKNLNLVFDTTFCGDWAGKTWSSSSCGAKAPTCQAYVKANPQAFGEAYWLVNGVTVYQAGSNLTGQNKFTVPASYTPGRRSLRRRFSEGLIV